MPPQLSFIGGAQVTGTTQQAGPAPDLRQSPINPEVDELEQLISSMQQPLPEAPKIGAGRKVLGLIGDAIVSRATVLAGGQPRRIGAFTASVRAEEESFRQETLNVEKANRDIERTIRIGSFQERRAAARRQADTATQLAIEDRKRLLNAENDFRQSLRDKIVDLNIIPEGVDLTEAPTSQLQEIIQGHDPAAAFEAVLSGLPPEMTLDVIDVDQSGKIKTRFVSKESKARQQELPAGVIAALIRSGEDPTPFIRDPNLANAASRAAAANHAETARKEATRMLEVSGKTAKQLMVLPNGEIDPVNQGIADAAPEINELAANNSSPEEVNEYYKGELEEGAKALEAGAMSRDQLADYLGRVRQMISIHFGDIPLGRDPQEAIRKITGRIRKPKP
jgi:hypothetical protein